jgi:RHS repeat-associated protein
MTKSSLSMPLLSLFVVQCLIIGVGSAGAQTHTCDPQGHSSVIGLENVAVDCIREGMNDDTPIHFVYRNYNCVNGVVTMTQTGNIVENTPNEILNPETGIPARNFRNKQGTYFLKVADDYTGLIDGKPMASYLTGGVYPDVFTKILDESSPPPSCRGGDFNKICKIEVGSTVNVGTGTLSHDQELFTLSNNRTLALGLSLHYHSVRFAPSSIGGAWSHTYEATLQPGAGSAMVFWEDGVRRVYEKYTAEYIPVDGDHSSLTRNGATGWTLTELDGLVRTFDSGGKLTTIVDRYGNALDFDYPDGRLASVTDATGRSVTFGYNATSGKLETVRDPAGNVYTLGYTGANLTSYTLPGNKGQWLYTYGANGLLESKKDPEQHLTSYTYQADNRLSTALADGDITPRSLSYSGASGDIGMVPDAYNYNNVRANSPKTFTFTETDGNGWSYTYDTLSMQISSATDPYGKVTDYYYNPDDTLRAMTVPFDGDTRLTTFYTHDENGNLLTSTEPVDISTYTPAIDPKSVDIADLANLVPPIKTAISYTYDSAANYYQIKSITDNRGVTPLTTTFDRYSEPDGQGGTWLVTRRTAPGLTSGTTLTSYLRQNSNGTIAGLTDENNASISISYYPVDVVTRANGSAGLVKSATFPDGVKLTVTGYDKNGNIIAYRITDSGNADLPVRTTLGYDPLNELTTILRESTANPLKFPANLTQYGYDNNGNRTSITDAEARTTSYRYTGKGQVSEITDARLKTTKLEYGATGCPSCANGADKLTAVRDANHVANNQPGTVYTYDKVGRIDTETDPMGKKTRYTWYDSGLLKDIYDATATPEKVLVTYKYNNRGQLTEKLYPDNTSVKYNYLPNGWLDSANNLTAGAVTFGYSFTYHANGRLKTVTDTNSRTISYDLYDAIGRKKQVTYFPATPDQKQIIYNYDSANRLQTITSPAGVFTYGYDALSRRSTLTYPNQITATYGYDDLQRLSGISHQYQSTAIATYGYTLDQVGNRLTKSGTVNETYRYDELYRLKEADTAKGTEKYGYDDVGNRLTGPGPKDTGYRYDTANRQTMGKLFGHDYDNQGNQLSRTTTNADKSWTMKWDFENRLTKMEKTRGADIQTVTFIYDPFGRRIEKKQSITKSGTTKITTWTYVYDGYDIALEIMTDSTTTRTFYTHGQNIDEHLALERSGSFYYYHQDGLGSVTAITDANRNVVQRYNYDSFGKITPQTNFANSYTFTDREYDPQTGLYYYRARYYDPMDGRFISKDPISFTGGDVNLYGFVQNNPVNWIDPLGWSRTSQAAWRNLGATLGFFLSLPVDAFEDLSTFGAGALANPATTLAMTSGGAALGIAIDALLTRPMLAQNNDDLCTTKSPKGKTFRGGKQKSRDSFGKYEKDEDFKRWWHRQGKKQWGGHDIEPEQLDTIHQNYEDIGRPKVK